MDLQIETELLQRLIIRAGIAVGMVEEGHKMLLELEDVVKNGKPKGMKKSIWNELLQKRNQLREKLNIQV